MALQQPGTGYRDPAKTMTIKALQERQKAAADAAARATAIPEGPMSSPFQGLAHMTGILSGQMQENRAAASEADARQQLARIKAQINPETGATQQQIADMSVLDPDFADKEYARAMAERAAIRSREDEQSFRTDERVAGQGFTTSERVAGETADISRLGVEDKFADENRADEARIADEASKRDAEEAAKRAEADAFLKTKEAEYDLLVKNGQMTPEEKAARLEQDNRDREATIQQKSPETFGNVPPEVAAAAGGEIAKHPERYEYNSKTQQVTPREKARSPADLAAEGKFTTGLIETRGTIANLRKALELAPNIYEGSGIMGQGGARQRASLVLKTPDMYDAQTLKQAQDTQAYFNIMSKEAILAMGSTLSGATTEFEMKRFLDIMANEQTPLATKQDELARMLAKVEAYEKLQTGQVEESGGDVNAGATQTTAPPPATTPAPADAASRKQKYGLE